MKTKIKVSHKKKISKVSRNNKGNRFSRFKNKKRSQFKWNGTGGSNPNPKKQRGFTGLHVKNNENNENNGNIESGNIESGNIKSGNIKNTQTMMQELNPNNTNYTGFENIKPRKHTQVEKSPVHQSSKQSQTQIVQKLELILPQVTYIEITDSFFQVQYEYKEELKKELKKVISEMYYFVISLDKLSIDRLQYYINNSIINKASNDKSDLGEFLGLNVNTLVVKVLNTGGQYRTGSSNDFIDVYESVEESVEKNIVMISYEENIDRMAVHNGFLINVFFFNDKDKDKHNILPIINKDISWLNSIYMDLNATNIVEGKKNIEYFLEQYKKNLINQTTKIFTCDDLNIDHTRLIFEEISNEREQYVIIGYPDKSMKPYIDLYNKNQSKFEKIYNDHKKNFMTYMAELHNSIPEKTDKIILPQLKNEIHKFYGYDDYYKYIANFYENAFTQEDKDNYNNPNYPANKEYGIKYDPNFQSKFKELQKAFYNELASKCLNKPMIKINYVFFIFKKHTEGKYKDMYVPAIFNFRELTHKHHSILERLEYLIKTRLAKIYGIIEDETKEDYKLWYSHYNYGDIFHIKTEYVHTMSNIQQQAYKYKNSISLEELIYMLSIPTVDLINLRLDYQKKQGEFIKNDNDSKRSNRTKKSHKLLSEQNKITRVDKCYNPDTESQKKEILIKLENFLDKSTKILLIFVETGNIYTIIYKNGIDGIDNNKFYKIKIQSNICSIYPKIIKNLYRTQAINEFENLIIEYKQFNKPNKLHKTSPNLDLSKVYDIVGLELYKVLEHKLINTEDYKNIMRYNPLLVRTIKKQNTKDNIIPITDLFNSPVVINELLKYNSIKIPNPYLQKPLIIRNIIGTEKYKSEFQKFKQKYNTNKEYIYDENIIALNNLNDKLKHKNITEETYKIEYDKFINKSNSTFTFQFIEDLKQNKEGIIIHCIHFNPDECGYNLIELIEATKSVIWVVPLYSNYTGSIYDNYNDFYANIPITSVLIPKFIGNFLKLNQSHKKLLNVINKIYFKDNKSCFINIGSMQAIALCLHIHVINNEYYKSSFANLEQGSRLEKMLSTKTALNLLNLETVLGIEYYNNQEFNINVLTHDKI